MTHEGARGPPRPGRGTAAPARQGGGYGAASAPASMPGCCLRRAAVTLAGSLVKVGVLLNAA